MLEDDALYDFAQLNDGNLVFVGNKSNTTGGLWTFVTDSTGKNISWKIITKIKYLTSNGAAITTLSVCAIPDGGFTVAVSNNCRVDNGGP